MASPSNRKSASDRKFAAAVAAAKSPSPQPPPSQAASQAASQAGSSQPFSQQYELAEELGRGAFSVVRKCRERASGLEFAAKIINIAKLNERGREKIEREIRICQSLHHPHIVQLHRALLEHSFHYLVFDLVLGGELFDDIVAREFYSEREAALAMHQILDSLAFCHRRSVLHRDIKPENLLLTLPVAQSLSARPTQLIKLADFGLALELRDPASPEWFGFAGTPGYMSPELVNQNAYSLPVDVWACGVVLYILLAGYPPFWHDDQQKLYAQIRAARYTFPASEFDSVSAEAKQLIRALLTVDPASRITAQQALQHPWIAQKDTVTSNVARQDTQIRLKSFNAKRKLKAAMITSRIVNSIWPGRKSSAVPADQQDAQEDAQPTQQDCVIPPVINSAVPMITEEPREFNAEEITSLTRRLLTAISSTDWPTYEALCDAEMTCFEPETRGNLIEGLEFHKFFFESAANSINALASGNDVMAEPRSPPGCVTPANSAAGVASQSGLASAGLASAGLASAGTPLNSIASQRLVKPVESLLHPKVRALGPHSALIAYIRVRQLCDPRTGKVEVVKSEETRIWQRSAPDFSWKNVHFHRSNI